MGSGIEPENVWPPEGCPVTYGQRKGTQEHKGTRIVLGQISALEWFPGIHGHWQSVRAHMTTRWVPRWEKEWCTSTYRTKMLPGHIWVPERCLGRYWHQNGQCIGVRACMGTGRVHGIIYGKERFSYEHMGTDRVSGHIWALEGCLSKYGHRKGARANMGTGKLLRHISAREGYLGTYW